MQHAVVLFDLETTGLPHDCGITQIGALHLDTRQTFCRFVNPGKPIESEAARITGITDAHVANEPPFSEVFPKFVEWLEQQNAEKPVLLIAHNGHRFDFDRLARHLSKHNIAAPEHWFACDTLEILKKHCTAQLPKSKNQGSLYEHIVGKPMENAHNALSDAQQLEPIWKFSQAFIAQMSHDQLVDMCTIRPFSVYVDNV